MFYSKVVVLALFACICVNDAKLDCQTSDWSSWGQTFGFGTRQRERVILRHPTNGGTPCPDSKDLFLTEKTSMYYMEYCNILNILKAHFTSLKY